MALPPGFRFHPTDEELVAYYLKRKVAGRSIEFNFITEIDLYKQEPWDLPEKSFLIGSDMEWYFFSPRDKKYPNGLRTNRATEAGYWKATGKDRNVKKAGQIVGMKKTLVFYRGRAPHGERMDWVMHEYRLNEEECEKVHVSQDLFVLCRVFKKSGVGPRSGEDRGPQTYVDDDIEKEPSGSFAEAVKKALEPKATPALPEAEAAPIEPPKVALIDNSQVAAPTVCIDDYERGEDAGNVTDTPAVFRLDNFLIDEPPFSENEDDRSFWESLVSITAELDLPLAASDTTAPKVSETRQGDRQVDSMIWNPDLSIPVAHPQQLQDEGGAGCMDLLQLELLESDDVMPPLVEELESNNLPNDSGGTFALSNFGENRNHQLRACGPARARSRVAFQHPTSDEAQQRARSSNDGFCRSEGTPQQSLSNTHFRAPTHGREDSTISKAMQSSPVDHFDTNLPSSSSDLQQSSASARGYGSSGDYFNEDRLISFEDSFLDFPLDEELVNMATEYNEINLKSAAASQSVGDQRSSEVNTPQMKHSLSVLSESLPRLAASPQESPSQEAKPLSKPLAGLMKLLGSLPALPASAAECSPDMKPLRANGELASTYSSIHLSAVTVTCTSAADGAQKVQAAVTDCRLQGDAQGVYRQVVSGSWEMRGNETMKPLCSNCDTAGGSLGLQRKVARGSNSGFVFVFALGAVTALCWFLLIRTLWRLASHVFTRVF